MTRFFSACVVAPEGAGAGAAAATGSGAGGGAGAGAETGTTGTGAGAGAAAAAGAGAAAGSSITPMMFSDTPAFFSFTRSAGVRLAGLLSLCKVLMIRASDNPALTDSITESTGEGAAFAFAGAALGVALGAAAGGAVCPRAIPTRKPNVTKLTNVNNLSFIQIPPVLPTDAPNAIAFRTEGRSH